MVGSGWKRLAALLAVATAATTVAVGVGATPAAAATPICVNVASPTVNNAGPVTLVLNALLLSSGAQIILTKSVEGSPIEATGEVVVGSTELRGTVDLTAHAPGSWHITIRNPDGNWCTFTNGLTVLPVGTPTITSVTPSVVAPGATGVVLTVTGTNLFRGAHVTIDDGDAARTNIAVTADAFGPAADGTQHRATVSVPALGAVKVGAHDVVLTNANGVIARCAGCLQVTQDPPTLTSVSPAILERGVPTTVTLTGSGFAAGTTASFGPGVTVGAAEALTATSFRVTATATDAAAVGPRGATVTNPDAQTVACAGCVSIIANHGNWLGAAYRDLLGRNPDAGGAAAWRSLIRAGVDRYTVAANLTGSLEFRRLVVDDLYQAILGRRADSAGRAHWAGLLASYTFVDLQAALLSSAEFGRLTGYQNGPWIDAVYVVALGRFPDAAGRAAWLGQLARGVPHFDVAWAILRAPEARGRQVDSFFRAYLRRSVDSAGKQGWAAALGAGLREEQLIAAIVASDEYFKKAG